MTLPTILLDLDNTLLGNHIELARSLGIKTWWITPNGPSSTTPPPESDKQGSLSDFLAWIEAGGLN